MHALLQDWIELDGSGSLEIIQSGARWLDLSGYQDVLFYLDARSTTSGVQAYMQYQTAPSVDPTLFTDMVASFQMIENTSPTVTAVLLSQNPTVPLAGLVRWKVTTIAGGAWRISFRIHCVAKRR